MNTPLDCIVVGCSAAGAVAARESAALGLRTLVLEEHSRPGKLGACSGLVSKRGLKLLDAAGGEFDGAVLNEVRGARLHAKNGAQLVVERRAPVACVLDRQRFDEALARQAKSAGAKILFKRRATAVKQNGEGVTVRCGKQRFDARFVIACDGAASRTAASLGFPKIPRFVLGYEAEFDGARVADADFVDLFFDARAFPSFFAWIIPAGARSVRVGFATADSKNFAYSKNSLYRLPSVQDAVKTPGAKRVREYAHVIPLRPRPRTQLGRVLLAGDAAGQVKASTGGGIVFGGLCASQAALSVKAALDSNDSNSLPDYERSWRKKYGGTLALHKALRWKLDLFGDAGLNVLARFGKSAGLEWFLREFGDMDFVFNFGFK